MRVFQLEPNVRLYSSNVFLVLGAWSRLEDVNTLIDAGADPAVVDFVAASPTGVGKQGVEQVILTHRHSDHMLMVPTIVQRFGARVYAWNGSAAEHLLPLVDGQALTVADRTFEVLHTPGHSSDSICLYCEEERALFSGDTPLAINSADGTYESCFVEALERLCARQIDTIYFGHGPALTSGCRDRLATTLRNVRQSRRRDPHLATSTLACISATAETGVAVP